MESVSLSKADRFFPLIAQSPEGSGGSISLQNILDLRDNGMLDALRALLKKIAQLRAQSQLFDDSLSEEPPINCFFRFVDAVCEVSQARRIMDSGQFLTVTRDDHSNMSLDPENFYLNPIKDCLHFVQERYGRFDMFERDDRNAEIHGSVERVIAMVKWLLLKNHAIDYLMTFEIRKAPESENFIVRVPKWDGSRAIPKSNARKGLPKLKDF